MERRRRMRSRWTTPVLLALLGVALAGCGRGEENAADTPAAGPAISGQIGDDLAGRDLVRIDAVRGSGSALRRGVAGVGRDDDWIMRPASGHQLGRLAAERDERVLAWQRDGRPLLSEPPAFDWTEVSVDATGGAHDHLTLMPEEARRPQGYVVDIGRLFAQAERAQAVARDAVGRELTDVQAEALVEIVRELHRFDDERVLDWLERLARGEVALTTLERRDLGPAEDELFGPHRIELGRATLDASAPAMHALRDAAAVTLLPASNQQRRAPLRELLTDPRMSHQALQSLRDHQPLPEPMAKALVETLGQWVDEAEAHHSDALRVQVTAVLDAIGGHDWGLMTEAQREAAERRENQRGGERQHLDLAVDLAVIVLRHDDFDVQQTALRMIQRWNQWGWQIPQRDRLEAVALELDGEAREQLLDTLDADG